MPVLDRLVQAAEKLKAGTEQGQGERILTVSVLLTSPIPWLFIRFHLQAVHKFVEADEQVDHRHYLEETFIIQSQLPRRGSMNGESVLT